MSIQVGERIPDATLRTVDVGKVKTVTTREIFDGKKVVLFGVPGAFTPTCSDDHLPGFVVRANDLKARGVATIACVAANDAYVMDAWARARGVGDSVLMLSDGNLELAEAMGLVFDLAVAGMGRRNRRFSMLVDDGVVKTLHVETGPGVNVTGAETILAEL